MPDLLTAKALREERAPLAKKTQEMADKVNAEKRDFTPEELVHWEQLDKDYNALTRRIEIAERSERVQGDQAAPAPGPGRDDTVPRKKSDAAPEVTEEHRALAMQAWLRRQSGMPLLTRHKDACKRTRLDPRRQDFPIPLSRDYGQVRAACWGNALERGRQGRGEFRALSAQIGTAGQYTVPTGFVNSFETALLAYADMRQVADVIRTDSGNDLPWPTATDTANKGSIIAENTAPGTTTQPTFAQVVYHAHKYTSGIVLVPREALDDSAFNLADWLGGLLGVRIGRINADHFTTGSGAGQPFGIVTDSTSGVTAASTSAIAADEIYALKHSVDPAYRQGAAFMMHDNTLLTIKKMKDAQGRYLWQSGLAGGHPDTLDGDPLHINQSMDSTIASGKKSLLYGQLSRYKIRDVNDVRMVRLLERYADADQQGFVVFMRSDGRLLDAGTHPVKYLVH